MNSKLTIIQRSEGKEYCSIIAKETGEILLYVKWVSAEQANVYYARDLTSPWKVFISEDAAMAAAIKEAKLMIDVEGN